MMKAAPREVHLCTEGVGHVKNTNCWCEPTRVYWQSDGNGGFIHVIEHNDETPAPHNQTIAERSEAMDWITRLLTRVGREPHAH